jgi:hypothetical protein
MRAGLLFIVAGCSFQVPGLPVSPTTDPGAGAPGVTNTANVPAQPSGPRGADLSTPPDLSRPLDLAHAADLASSHCSNMCCDDSCAAGESCQLACDRQGCSCDFTCHAGSRCGVTCNDQARCNLTVEDGESVDVTCAGNSTCDVQCGDNATCNVACPPSSRCSCKGDNCNLTGCKPMKCRNGVVVCGELCPP